MHSPLPDASAHTSEPAPVSPWIEHLGRVSYIRGHISLFAAGSVILLALDLLSGSDRVWADTVISLWAVLLVAHGILAVIARLLRELLSEDDAPPRPAAEATWRMPGSWALPSSPGERTSPSSSPAEPIAAPSQSPSVPAEPRRPGATERVSWAEATRAAWLARRSRKVEADAPNGPGAEPPDAAKNDNDDTDFTPLKLD